MSARAASRGGGAVGLTAFAALAALAAPGGLAGQTEQMERSIPPPGARTHTVVIGPRYEAGGFTRWLFGDDYREVWTTPIEVRVLDLGAVGGGLTPIESGGFGQSVTLEFRGADGLEYAVRSVDKNPTRRLIPELKDTFVASIVQDQISSLLPTAALVVDPIMEAAGVIHPTHRLVVVPDDPRLGEFRERFAGMIGMLVDRPQEGPDGTPGFAGSRRIAGSDDLRDELEEGPCNRADARAYLKVRLLDMLIGDRDRHPGQWRWARYPEGDCYVWQPIPVDRDQAFVDYDGVVMSLFRRARPQQIGFDEEYPSLTGLTFNAWELDRELLVELEQPVWEEVAAEIQREITDPVIEAAVRRLPAPHYELVASELETALKQRRDALPREAVRYYRRISRWAEIQASDEDEYAELEHLPDGGLAVRIGLLGDGGRRATPYFERRFTPDVTREVRLFLRGGDDDARILGGSGRIVVRVDGGGGDDRFANESAAGGGKTRFYDDRGDNEFRTGTGARIDRSSFERPPAKDLAHRYALDWGGRTVSFPFFTYTPDLGLYFGARWGAERYGFRKVPFRTRHSLSAGLATAGPEPVVSYDVRFRHVLPGRSDGLLGLAYSGINIIRFHGFGNETPISGPSSFFKVEQRELVVAPAIEWGWGRDRGGNPAAGTAPLRETVRVGLGPVLKLSETSLEANADRFIGTLDPAPFGTGSFGQVGGQAWVEVDTRDNTGYAKSGARLRAEGAFYPSIWDVESSFGTVEGSASVFLTPPIPVEPTLALRVGGKKVWGSYPFFEAAYLGGRRELRGFFEQRFAGDAAVYGNAELRLPLFSYNLLVPTRLGVFGVADAGRVYFDGDPAGADEWHTGFGGGLWWAFINRLQTLSVAIVNGDDRTGVYVTAGFMF